MYKVWSDSNKNRLFTVLKGVISIHEAQALKAMVVSEIEKLKPGFDILNDISQFQMGPPKAISDVKRVMQYIEHKRVGRVFRITGGSRSGIAQFARAALGTVKYKAELAESLAEAEKKLDLGK